MENAMTTISTLGQSVVNQTSDLVVLPKVVESKCEKKKKSKTDGDQYGVEGDDEKLYKTLNRTGKKQTNK